MLLLLSVKWEIWSWNHQVHKGKQHENIQPLAAGPPGHASSFTPVWNAWKWDQHQCSDTGGAEGEREIPALWAGLRCCAREVTPSFEGLHSKNLKVNSTMKQNPGVFVVLISKLILIWAFNFKTQLSCSSVWYLANWSTLELGIRCYFFLAWKNFKQWAF